MESITTKAIASALGGIKSAIDIASKLSDASEAIKQADWKLQLAELVEKLADARIQISRVKAELNDKEEEINELKQSLKMKKKLKFNEKYGLYEAEEDGKTVRYCTKCYAEEKLVPVREEERLFVCKRCEQFYHRPEYKSKNEGPPRIVSRPMNRGNLW
ncbi:hypothetical protein [Desulfovibrio sp. JC022]|uniref:hypothetical protein n=1 Tax=Desulfovibrio sp. JC022 TaxID=2593642 RepID=UPI0013CF96CA|nr:hypothetical protein [Desulfovibrio sp. JC022]NDV23935.1 hypothetical protein [Desulfovibrio sp. JC022]